MQDAPRALQQPTEAPAVQVVQVCTTYLLELVTACEVCSCGSVLTCRCPKASGELTANTSAIKWPLLTFCTLALLLRLLQSFLHLFVRSCKQTIDLKADFAVEARAQAKPGHRLCQTNEREALAPSDACKLLPECCAISSMFGTAGSDSSLQLVIAQFALNSMKLSLVLGHSALMI